MFPFGSCYFGWKQTEQLLSLSNLDPSFMIQIKSDNRCFSDIRFPNDGVVVPREMIPPMFLPRVEKSDRLIEAI